MIGQVRRVRWTWWSSPQGWSPSRMPRISPPCSGSAVHPMGSLPRPIPSCGRWRRTRTESSLQDAPRGRGCTRHSGPCRSSRFHGLALLDKGKSPFLRPLPTWTRSSARHARPAYPFAPIRRSPSIPQPMCQGQRRPLPGCGTCVAACPAGAIQGRHFTDEQINAQIEALLREPKKTGGVCA